MEFLQYGGRYVGCNPVEVGQAAERRIVELEDVIDDILVHGVEGPTKDWMMVPRVEWDQAAQRAKLKPR